MFFSNKFKVLATLLLSALLPVDSYSNGDKSGVNSDKPKKIDYEVEVLFHSEKTSSVELLKEKLLFAGEEVPFEYDAVYDMFLKNMDNRLSRHFVKSVDRQTEKWFPIIEPILAQYGIPDDFKYLAAIESNFNPHARSRVGAVGVWQFMPKTAREYGLVVRKNRDDRKDVKKSTIAACKYLKDLHRQLGSWTLAAAAYNVGQGALSRAMVRQNKDSYYSLKLNSETANYVYKILVYKHVYANTLYISSLDGRIPVPQKLESINMNDVYVSEKIDFEHPEIEPLPVDNDYTTLYKNNSKRKTAKNDFLFINEEQ